MSSHTSTSNANVWVAYPDFEHEIKAQYVRLERCMRMIAGTDQTLLRGEMPNVEHVRGREGGDGMSLWPWIYDCGRGGDVLGGIYVFRKHETPILKAILLQQIENLRRR
jgi:hypothetical protein